MKYIISNIVPIGDATFAGLIVLFVGFRTRLRGVMLAAATETGRAFSESIEIRKCQVWVVTDRRSTMLSPTGTLLRKLHTPGVS
jgi:hypothetical protein